MNVWIAYAEHGAVHQDRVDIGVYTTEAAAQVAADKALRDAIEEGQIPYYHPDTHEEEADWDIDTGVDGPFNLDDAVEGDSDRQAKEVRP
jgi:hypothetical protein